MRLPLALCCAAVWTVVFPMSASALKHLGPGDIVPDVALVTPDGKTALLSEVLPERGGLLVCWATWNPRSPETLDYLAELHERYANHGHLVLPLNVDHEGSSPDEMAVYATTYAGWGLPWPTTGT